MIHYAEIAAIEEEIKFLEHDINLITEFAGCVEGLDTELINLHTTLSSRQDDLQALITQQDSYRDGYDAGIEFHLGSGLRGEPSVHHSYVHWQQGFSQAGDDS